MNQKWAHETYILSPNVKFERHLYCMIFVSTFLPLEGLRSFKVGQGHAVVAVGADLVLYLDTSVL